MGQRSNFQQGPMEMKFYMDDKGFVLFCFLFLFLVCSFCCCFLILLGFQIV